MMSRVLYYLSSIPTLLRNIKNWGAIFNLLLFRQAVIVKFRSGLSVKVRSLMDVWIVKETCLDKDYEKLGVEIEDGWQVIDVGAGLGDFVLSFAKNKRNCKIWAYEPFAESFQLLQENISLNQLKNVVAFQTAVSSQTGTLMLALTGQAVQHITFNEQPDTFLDVPVIEVPSQSLSDIFAENGLSHCNFLKVDCEGGEFDILFNTPSDTLGKIQHICLEYHNNATAYSNVDLEEFLRQNGFSVRITKNPVHDYLGILYARNLNFN